MPWLYCFFVFGILWTIFKDGKNPVLITCVFSTVLIELPDSVKNLVKNRFLKEIFF